jgi:hypothetical protein
MIGWIGFIGKVVEAVVKTAAGKTVARSFDRRYRAAHALVKFYHTLHETNEILDRLIRIFDQAVEKKKPVIFSKDLVPLESRIHENAAELRAAFTGLCSAIYVFDPELARMLARIQGFKMASLTAFGALYDRAVFRIEVAERHPFSSVSFTTFSDDIKSLDLAKLVSESRFPHILDDFSTFEMNKLVAALGTLLIEDSFGPSDFGKVDFLNQRLKNQRQLAVRAEKGLRKLIASQFTIADLLDTKPYKMR